MITYKIIALSFVIITPITAQILVKLTKLDRLGFYMPDLALPLFALQLTLLSSKFFLHHFLPHYTLAMAILALMVAVSLLFKTKDFAYRRFVKLFWRIGSILTFIAYLITVVMIFTVN